MTSRRRMLALPGLLGLLLLCGADSEKDRMTPADRKRLSAATLKSATKTSAIPPEARKAFADMVGQTSFEMAEPSQPFQVGDAIAPGPPLPGRRLIFTASDEGLCVIHYERGGVAHLYEAVAFELSRGKPPELAWAVLCQARLADLDALRQAVAADKIRPSDPRDR